MSNNDDRTSAHAVNLEASVWMERGIALLNASTLSALREAVGCFDKAIELRRRLPLDDNPIFPYGLAAGWLNRGGALTRIGMTAELQQAVESYDTALEVLSVLSMDDNPLFRRREVIAWQNRGLTLQALRDKGLTADPKTSFEKALASLEKGSAIADRDFLLATVLVSFANALVTEKNIEFAVKARSMVKRAAALVATTEKESTDAGEIGLKSRHILCQLNIARLFETKPGDSTRDEVIAETTDAVDEGMALARHWEERGIKRFQPLAQSLFCFGARAYQIFQPHFLGEFLLENLDPSQGAGAFTGDSHMHSSALESLWRAFRMLQSQGCRTTDAMPFEEMLEKMRELSIVDEKLAVLRKKFPPTS